MYYIQLTTAELSSYGYIAIRFKNGSTAEFQDIGQVIAYDPYSRTQVYNPWDAGAPDIDYKKIRGIIKEELGKLPTPPLPENDDSAVLAAISDLKSRVGDIELPEQKETDLAPVLAAVQSCCREILAAINAIEKPEKEDLTDIRAALIAINDLKVSEINEKQDEITGLLDKIHNFFAVDIEDIKKEVSSLNEKFDSIPYVIARNKND